jgi:hypothetical protein
MESAKLQERIAALERRLAEAKARLPRHSVSPAMLIEIEEMEEELERLRSQLASGG